MHQSAICPQQIKQKGFTLVELLVAISIIATLTAIVLPNFMGAREKAKDAQKKQDMTAMKNSLRMYYNDNQEYPDTRAIWQTAMATYSPQMVGIGYTYFYRQTNNGDGFQLCVDLDSTAGSEIEESQSKCAVSAQICASDNVGGDIMTGQARNYPNRYVVCAN